MPESSLAGLEDSQACLSMAMKSFIPSVILSLTNLCLIGAFLQPGRRSDYSVKHLVGRSRGWQPACCDESAKLSRRVHEEDFAGGLLPHKGGPQVRPPMAGSESASSSA